MAWFRRAAAAGAQKGLQVEAVDTSGVIRRCPFCGSGQVLQRSDGTTHCSFCDTSFVVTMMPNMPAMPTFVDGQDLDNENNMGPEDIPAEGMDPMDPTAMPPGGPPVGGDVFVPPEGSQDGGPGVGAPGGGQPPQAAPQEDDEDDDKGGGSKPPWLKGSALRTAQGAVLDPDDFVRHLAISVAPPERRTLVLTAVREERDLR